MPRRTYDFYETPPHYLDALGSVLEIPCGSRVIEPCVGSGAIEGWLYSHFDARQNDIDIVTNDIDKTRDADTHFDARDVKCYDHEDLDWWITNPPFNIIDEILTMANAEVENVITLARLSVLEPTVARRELYSYYQPDMLIVLPRYCFRLNDQGKRATDSVTCAWIGWGPQVPRVTTVWTTPPPESE